MTELPFVGTNDINNRNFRITNPNIKHIIEAFKIEIMEKYTIDQLKTEKIAVKIDNTKQLKKLVELTKVNTSTFDLDKLEETHFNFQGHLGSNWQNPNFYEERNYTIINFDQIEFDFVLPKKWYVKATRENESILREWRGGNHTGWEENLVMISDMCWCETEEVKGYTEITFEQFKQYVLKESNMEEEIEGYKIKDIKYVNATKALLEDSKNNNWWETHAANNLNERGWNFAEGNNDFAIAQILREAGVLDLWFEKVYKQQFKVGDWVCETWDASPDKTKAYQITDIVKDNVYYTRPDSTVALFNQLRLATKEEIEAVNIKLPIINGYEGKDINGTISYGCSIFDRDIFKEAIKGLLHINKNIKYINHIELDSLKVTNEQIKQFDKYFKANP